ncbi:hypothetical protein ACQ4PT_070809 [Festuca glaucescens]
MQFAGRRKSSLVGAGAAPGPARSTRSDEQAQRVAAEGRAAAGVRGGVFFFVFVIIMYGEDIRSVTLDPIALPGGGDAARGRLPGRRWRRRRPAARPRPETCDLSKGEWVLDNASYPLYREEECSFLTSQVTCMRNGRRDDNYQKWRWQPSECDMPRFDAKVLMERLRNKRMMFVGDSLNRNQWESMVCLVQSAVSPDKKYVTWEDQRVVFHAWEFNATVEFYWSPFLVESNSDNPKIHSIQHRIIDAESSRRTPRTGDTPTTSSSTPTSGG